jgi:nucleotide-binding universal stress UspA family protein
MLPLRRILFPVDFSDSCRTVVPHVIAMTKRFPAELFLVHAFEPLPLPIYDEIGAAPEVPPESDVRKLEEDRIRQFARDTFPSLPVTCLVDCGEPGAVIANAVQRHGIDLVMMPTQGHGRFRRLLLGSVTAKVLHDVGCMVWTGVHDAVASHAPGVSYKSIVCALSMDEEAADVMKAAAVLAKADGAELSLVHVVEQPPLSWKVDFAPYQKQLMDICDRDIRRMAAEAGIKASVNVLAGPPAETIRREAMERAADLLVVGRGRSQGTLSRLWSSLYEIVREAPCPVLSI